MAVTREVRRVWQVLAQQPIGVFIRPSLPRAPRIAEIDVDVGGHRKCTMRGEFRTSIPRQGLDQPVRQAPDSPGDGADHGLRFFYSVRVPASHTVTDAPPAWPRRSRERLRVNRPPNRNKRIRRDCNAACSEKGVKWLRDKAEQ